MAKRREIIREQWGSRIGVILAVAGSAVGLGNFLRFPGKAAQNGGGAFLLPYFISLLVLGIPLCWAEWTMGRYAGIRGFNSAPGIFSVIWRNPLAKYFGGVALLIPLIIYMYYVLIEAWCLGYAINYLNGALMLDNPSASAYESFFNGFVGANADGALLAEGNRIWLLLLLATFALNFTLIYRGVTKGIEMFCRFAMPVMVLLALVVLVRVLTLGGPDPSKPNQMHSVVEGLGFMWNPQPEKLLSPKTWLEASGQIFFSLSVGFGIIINYASYLRENDDVVLSGLTSSSMNEFFEVCLGGLITLPAAFIFLGVAAGDMGTFGLGFIALPNVFALMPAGQFFGFLWFFMLFVAAVTSSVSMLQPVIAFLEEGFGLKRHASVTILGLITALGCGFVVYFSKDLVALDTFDFWIGSVLIFMLAMVQAIMYGWIFGIKKGEIEAHRGAHIRIPKFVQWMLKYVVPVYLLAIFIGFCWQELPSRETFKFETDSEFSRALDRGEFPENLRRKFEQNEADLPDKFSVSHRDKEGRWLIRDEENTPKYALSLDQNRLRISTYEVGYVEAIGNQRVALASILFIGAVLAFLLIMIHIAGRRWKAEGRFDHIDDEAATQSTENV